MDLVFLKCGESGLWAGYLHGESPTGSLQGGSFTFPALRGPGKARKPRWQEAVEGGGGLGEAWAVSPRAAPAISPDASALQALAMDVQGAGSKSVQSSGPRWTGWCEVRVRVQIPFSVPSLTEPDISLLEKRPELKTLSLRSLGRHSLITACDRPTQFQLQRQK